MAPVIVRNIAVVDNPTEFLNPMQFRIAFECIQPLESGAVASLCAFAIVSRLILMLPE
jgi:hypothetical protein